MGQPFIFLLILLTFLTSIFSIDQAYAANPDSIGLTSREIVERLTRLEEGQKALGKRFDDLRQDIKKEFNGFRAEFRESQNSLRDELKDDIIGLKESQNSLRDELKDDIIGLRNLIYVLLAGIMGLIGFVLWDRRSAISPVINKTRDMEEREYKILVAMREYAQKEPKMAEVLRSMGLL